MNNDLFKSSYEKVCFPTRINDRKKKVQDKHRNSLGKVPFLNSVATDQLNNKHIPPNAYTYPYVNSDLLKKHEGKMLYINNSNLDFATIDGSLTDVPKYQNYNQFKDYDDTTRMDDYYKNIKNIQNKNIEHFGGKKKVAPPNTFPLAWTCYEKNGAWVCPLRGDKVV